MCECAVACEGRGHERLRGASTIRLIVQLMIVVAMLLISMEVLTCLVCYWCAYWLDALQQKHFRKDWLNVYGGDAGEIV